MQQATRFTVLGPALAILLSFAGDAPRAAVVEPALEAVQTARAAAGAPPLERRPELDRAAETRARTIAGLPHKARLSYEAPIAESLREAGVARFSAARAHLNMVRGYRYPGVALARQWQNQPSWAMGLDPHTDGIGLGSATAADGWIVMVVVLVTDAADLDGPALEAAILAAVNEVRGEHGLDTLRPLSSLTAVARGHSADMAARGYMDHRSPEGLESADRLHEAGISFRAMAENIHMSRGQQDPVTAAVAGWMESPGHREAILEGRFTHTGVGVAEAADGTLYATQVFLLPPPTQ